MFKAKANTAATKPASKGLWKAWLSMLLLFSFVWIYTEICLHLLIFGGLDRNIVYPICFGFFAAGLSTMICAALPPLWQKIVGTLLTALAVIWAEVQYMYQAIFDALMPLSNLTLGGNVADFRTQLVYSLGKNIPQVLALLLPLLLWILLLILRKILRVKGSWRQLLAGLGAAAAGLVGAFALMLLFRTEAISVLHMFNSPDTVTTASYRTVGMTGTTISEIRFMLFPKESEYSLEGLGLPEVIQSRDPEKYNIDKSINFDALAADTLNPELQRLDRFFFAADASPKNEYTGMLKDFNLVYICAESFSPLVISPELTPTLYKMVNNGFVFKNFYGSFKSVTTNGEYTMCTGLFPDLSRTKTSSSFDETIGHYLPYCLGNALGEMGYETWAYHNYMGEFYNRNLTHANMGYTFKSTSNGLTHVTNQWPASDLEMMQDSVDDFINSDEPFHAYYMTFSGHYQYDWHNSMSAKNRDRVQGLDKTEIVKAYIACNLELEDALSYLVERLEAAGKLDKTLIVMTNDHYPYGLKKNNYNDLAGTEVDTHFEKYHNSFICYTAALEQPVVVEDYCCTADILPTVLNLLGVEYDSRLLAGTDVLSDAPHVAVIETGSFLTKDFRYDADTGEVIPHSEGVSVSGEELQRWQTLVNQKMEISRLILNSDYYAHVFGRSGLDQRTEDNFVYEDVTEIFAQASVSWVVKNQFMDPLNNQYFGADLYIPLGESLEAWYRIMGRPETSPKYLPEGFVEARNDPARLAEKSPGGLYPPVEAFDENYKYYDAVCWAFQVGMLREDDPSIGPDETMSYLDAAVQCYRYAQLIGVDTSLHEVKDSEGNVVDRIANAHEAYPQLTEEQLYAITWCQDLHIVRLSSVLNKQIENSFAILPRGRIVSYLYRTCTVALGGDPFAEGGMEDLGEAGDE